MDYHLRQFDDESLNRTDAEWGKQLEKLADDLIPSEYQRILAWAREHAAYDDAAEVFAYGIFQDKKQSASAIAEVIYARTGKKWLKLLDVHLSPEIDLSFATQDVDLERLTGIFAAAVVGSVHLTKTHKARVTKLYGRSGTLLSFLKGFSSYFQAKKVPSLSASIEGRWLVFRQTSRGS